MHLVVLLLSFALAAVAGDLRIERVFGKEVPTGPYKHPASIATFANGDLYICYYGGAGEYATDTSVYGSRLKKGSTRWTAPKVIAHDPLRSTGNGVVWQAPDGLVWLFYVVRFGDTWSDSRIQVKISKDNAETWSDASLLDFREGMMVRGKPIALRNGDYLLPIYHEVGHDPEVVGKDSASLFLYYDHQKKTWTSTNEVHSRIGNIQPSVVQLDDQNLLAFCRRGGGYGPTKDGWIVRTESHDGGRTWTEGVETNIPNPNAAVELIRLANGHLVLIYNDSMSDRTPLRAALSTDNGQTWPRQRNIGTGDHDYAYPSALQTPDGKIHLVYTTDGRSIVNHAVFDEDWIR